MKRRWTPTVDLSRSKPPSGDGAAATFARDATGNERLGLALARPIGPARDEEDKDLEGVYRRHGGQVSRWVARLAGPGFDVEDIVHDVFLVVQRRLGEFRGDALISTWLYEITVRVVHAHRRRWRRRRWLWPFQGNSAPNDAGEIEVADDRVSPLDALERRQAMAHLYRMLDALDEKYRTPVILFELEGVSCREIAVITGTSISNVWARVSRGREKLIKALAQSETQSEGKGKWKKAT
jgi:RNA polymerase sigma-70 factor, ECF subfamily